MSISLIGMSPFETSSPLARKLVDALLFDFQMNVDGKRYSLQYLHYERSDGFLRTLESAADPLTFTADDLLFM